MGACRGLWRGGWGLSLSLRVCCVSQAHHSGTSPARCSCGRTTCSHRGRTESFCGSWCIFMVRVSTRTHAPWNNSLRLFNLTKFIKNINCWTFLFYHYSQDSCSALNNQNYKEEQSEQHYWGLGRKATRTDYSKEIIKCVVCLATLS